MKRIISLVIVFMFLPSIPMWTNAEDRPMDIVLLDDGSYITIEITTLRERVSGSVTGNKVYTHYDENGTSNWKVTLSGSFTYTGSNATCTSSNMNVSIYDSAWYTVSKSASKSGNQAMGSAIMGRTSLGNTVARVPVSLTLSCDANGNLS